MSAHGWIALVVVAAGLVILCLSAALEAAIIYVSRTRAHVYASRKGIEWEALHQAIEERSTLFAALDVARVAAGVFATAFALYALLWQTGLRTRTLLLAAVAAAVAGILVQALPRTLVRQSPERWGLALAPVALVYRFLFGWAGWLFDLPGRLLLRLFGLSPPAASQDEPEEILRLVEYEESTGGIEEEERQMIRGVIGLEDTTAREIMVPRLDIIAAAADETVEAVVGLIVSHGFSRVPLYEQTIDNITGILYAKDLLRCLAMKETAKPLAELTRPAYFIPETKKVDELLAELRQNKVHIAIVVDEYGGTAGLVTIEDLIEEIVGEIEDEYDRGDVTVERVSEDEAVVDARANLEVLNELFGLEVDDEDVDTVGGLIYDRLGKIPATGDVVSIADLTLTVLSVAGHRIKKVHIVRTTASDGEEVTGESEQVRG